MNTAKKNELLSEYVALVDWLAEHDSDSEHEQNIKNELSKIADEILKIEVSNYRKKMGLNDV